MGISSKSNGRKSDKETQSPILKIFKDMQKDTIDQEKITLLKDKKKDKKKKSYSESRSKSDPRSYDSSSTGRYKTNKQATITVQDILKDKEDYGFDRSRSDGLRGGVKESYWFWKDSKKKSGPKKINRATEDTYSYVSCALKKIISSEFTCVALLLLLLSASVVLIFLVIFKGDNSCEMKQLIKRQLPEGYGTERIKWDRQLNSLDSVSDILDNSGNNLKRSYLSDVNAELSGDLASVLDTQKIDTQTSAKLQDFFQKLVQADLKIKKLKQDMNHYYQMNNLDSFPERFKRSLKSNFNNPRSRALNVKKRKNKIFKRNSFKDKTKSFKNTFNVTGYVIEEEKVLVQYEPGRKRNFPKCSHSHEIISHEKKLKHPFYKHSQRIDEMLNYKKPEIFTSNFIVNDNMQKSFQSSTNKMKIFDYKVYFDKEEIKNQNKQFTKTRTDTETTFDLESFLSTTPVNDVALSVSSFINPWQDKPNSKTPFISSNNRMGYRKLMEADEEDDEENDEELNYDVKELLNNDNIERFRMDRAAKIKKRDSNGQFDHNHYNDFPSQILNPNWKGPMPFYPDEINAMIKHAALQHFNIQPVKKEYTKSETDKIKKDVSDTEYIEDYADNKFNRMVKMAQAYSDYGVVYNKKNEESKEKIDKPETRFKQSLNPYFLKNDANNTMPLKPISGSSEGLRIEFRKGTKNDVFMKNLNKHIKFVKYKELSTGVPTTTVEYESITPSPPFSVHVNSAEFKNIAKNNKKIKLDTHRGFRSLQSIDIQDESDDKITEFNQISKRNTTNIDSVFSFLAIMGDWFRTLSNLSGESNGMVGSSISNNITRVNSTKSKNKRLEANNSNEILYPSYDVDMVDNIGHRSRVLMSVAGNNTNDEFYKHERHIDTESSSQSDSDNIVPIALILAENTTNRFKENKTNKNENMTSIVKRSIDDSKLVFWNDLYDDNEYGIKLDYGDNIREKHLVNNRGVVQKSKDWLHEKFNNLTRKVKNRTKTTTSQKIFLREKVNVKSRIEPKNSKPKKRNIRNYNESPEATMKGNFEALNANMKRVCQEAARAVLSTKNIEGKKIREDNKEAFEATSLMQQLVRLMSDLVDIQVQQKTCAKLPSDLQVFLEWLTGPLDNTVRVDDLTPGLPDYAAVDDAFVGFDKSTQSDFLTTLNEDSHQDDRTECLGTIRAVQDLIQQYDGMNDDDKSKMTGVKEYLQNQLKFLNNKLNDNLKISKLYKKRELPRIKRDSSEKPKKIIKNFSKKHTRSTFSDYVTERHVDNFILNDKLAKNNINNDIGVKIMEEKLTKDENKRP